ncbi:hypothetical protein MRX96_038080 [Rhipicephalus microplus]
MCAWQCVRSLWRRHSRSGRTGIYGGFGPYRLPALSCGDPDDTTTGKRYRPFLMMATCYCALQRTLVNAPRCTVSAAAAGVCSEAFAPAPLQHSAQHR